MPKIRTAREGRLRRHLRVRKKVEGTAVRPRLAVFRSTNHIYCQVINDEIGHTVAAASDLEAELRKLDDKSKSGLAELVGTAIAERAKLAGVVREHRPRWLFAPYWVDAHPDHVAAVELIEAARFWAKLTKCDLPHSPHHPERVFHYHCVHLRTVEKPAFVLDISDYWERKISAIAAYESQFIVGRPTEPPTFLDRLRDQAAYWGWSIGAKYGEPFYCRETLGLRGFGDVL